MSRFFSEEKRRSSNKGRTVHLISFDLGKKNNDDKNDRTVSLQKKQAIMESSSSSNRIVFKFIQIFFLIIGIIQFEHFFVVDNSLTQV